MPEEDSACKDAFSEILKNCARAQQSLQDAVQYLNRAREINRASQERRIADYEQVKDEEILREAGIAQEK